MKYSLRSLMIGITLVSVVLGGEIEYLRRWAAFHEEQTKWHRDMSTDYQHRLADDCRKAMLRPWTSVKEEKEVQLPKWMLDEIKRKPSR
jgi:hypothetical protein